MLSIRNVPLTIFLFFDKYIFVHFVPYVLHRQLEGQEVNGKSHHKGSDDINNGMLFHKYRGCYDKYSLYQKQYFYPKLFPGDAFGMNNGDAGADGVVYMNGWENICRRIFAVDHFIDNIYKNIVSAQSGQVRAKSLTIGPEGADNKENLHAGIKEEAESAEVPAIFKVKPGTYG